MSESCVTLRTTACQPPLSMRFPRQEYWSGLLCSSSKRSSQPGTEPMQLSPASQGGFFPRATWEALIVIYVYQNLQLVHFKYMGSILCPHLTSIKLLTILKENGENTIKFHTVGLFHYSSIKNKEENIFFMLATQTPEKNFSISTGYQFYC